MSEVVDKIESEFEKPRVQNIDVLVTTIILISEQDLNYDASSILIVSEGDSAYYEHFD
jgi:hypothetical protein